MTLTVGSLFSGIGGIELGLERAGMKVLWQVENNEWCQKVLTKHWPEVPKYGDVQELSASSLEAVDVIAGGFPCQPVSFAGKREAQADPRWLWPHFARLVDDLRPRYVLVENVPGLRSAGGTDVVTDLTAMGYDCEWGELSAAGVGAPHLRNRVFIVAYPSSQREPERSVDEVEGQGVVVSDSGSVGSGLRSVHTKPSGQGREPSGASESALVRPSDGPSDAEGVSSGSQNVADSERSGPQRHWRKRELGEGGEQIQIGWGSTDGGEETVADSDDVGWEWRPRIFREAGWGQLADSSQWAVEPDVGRLANGIPGRVDRLKGLGNAVVPQVAQHIGHLIVNDYEDQQGE